MEFSNEGLFPDNLLKAAFGWYGTGTSTNSSRTQWKKKLSIFIQELKTIGGDEEIGGDFALCVAYFEQKYSMDDIVEVYNISYDVAFEKMKRVINLLSRYWYCNPNLTASRSQFLQRIVGLTGDPDAAEALMCAGITSIQRLVTHCQKNGFDFKEIPTMRAESKAKIAEYIERALVKSK